MKYFLMDRNSILEGKLEVWGESRVKPTPLPHQFIYETTEDGNIPNNWEYSHELDTIIDLGDFNYKYATLRKTRMARSYENSPFEKEGNDIIIPLKNVSFMLNYNDILDMKYLCRNMGDKDFIEWCSMNKGKKALYKKDLLKIINLYKEVHRKQLLHKIVKGD